MSKNSANKVRKSEKRWSNPNWSLGAVIVALIGTFLLLVSLLSKPQFVIMHHTVVLTQGIVAPAVLMGAIVWAMVEFFTPPGRSIEDLLVRIIPAFIIGAFIVGLLGYMFSFGKFVIEPAFNGNPNALLFLVSVLVAVLAVTWNAAWSHKHGFRGQKSGKASVLTRSESGTSKGARGMLALLIIFIVAMLIVPIGAGLGGLFLSGHDSSHVLQNESSVVYITGTSGPVPFGQVNGTATFDFPSATVNNVTTYSHTVYVESNLILAELNNFAVSRIMFSTKAKDFNVTMGTGTNATDFVPVFNSSSGNSTFLSLAISPALLTGNQSSPVTFEIQANVTSMSLSISAYGNNSLVTVFGPYPVMQISYIIGAVLLFASAFLEISVHDISLNSTPVAQKGGKRE
ncbi:hypothetical protein DMB44_04395 [Thermoplasma sp. Kam2015]|uniref:hypothetical protein n=1 Tax=Thermoplasma sp. Kam2015 TaxID=2094122 RepID=UPI000D86EC22|nr:hypothetical protein [Thermoplasma sp. Kam2015]PYB68290.1 hypothetical protein DMB44_04395 [Thermoplasma sp. Kam2015]